MLGAWRERRASAPPSRSPGARSRSRTRARSTSPRPGSPSSTSSQLLPRGGRGRAARRGRPAERARPLRRRHPRRVLLPEARAGLAPGLDRGASSSASRRAAPPRRSCRATRPRSPGWRTSAASSSTRTRCARRTSTIPTSCASTSTRCRASSGRSCVAVAAGRARGARRPRARGLAEDVGLARHPRQRADPSRAGRSTRCGAPRWRWRARSSGARPTLATSKWWKEERHGVFLDYNQNAKDRTVCSAYSVRPKPDARVSAPVTWDELAAVRSPEDFTLRTMPARFAAIGDRHAGIDEQPVLARGAAGAVRRGRRRRGWATRPGRRTTRSRPGEPPRVAAVASARAPAAPAAAASRRSRSSRSAARDRKEDALAGLERWKARHPEAAAHLEPADVLVDSMRGRSSTWTRVRVNLEHVPEALRPAQEPLDPDDGPSWASAPGRPAAPEP